VRSRFFLLMLLVVPALGQAQDSVRYISDELAVTLRQHKDPASQALGLLTSGARLELLESDEASGYARVRTTDGREGWVLERFLKRAPIARDRVQQLERQLAESQAALKQLQAAHAELSEQHAALSAGRPVAPQELVRENEALRLAMAESEREREGVLRRYDAERATQRTLLLGGALVGGGVLLALLLRWLWPRRRGWGDL
jgi:SH3 domain protein